LINANPRQTHETQKFFLGEGGTPGTAAPATISAKLFRARLALIESLDQQASQGHEAFPVELLSHRTELANKLRSHVAACPSDNFLVRPHLDVVEHFSQSNAWGQLSGDDHVTLSAMLAPLPSALAEQEGDTDADARRFDLIVYKLQLALLQGQPRFAKLQDQVRAIASLLEEQNATRSRWWPPRWA